MYGEIARGRSGRRFGYLTTVLLAASALVAACGGGGDGGGGGGGGESAYSLSTSSVSFSATQGGAAPAPQTVTLTVHSGSVFIATSQSGGEFSHVFNITGQTTGEIVITPFGPTTAGTFTGTITVRGCGSLFCDGSDVPGSPKTINVTYTVAGAPALTSSVATVDFNALTGTTPAAKTLTLGSTSGSLAWTSQIDYPPATPTWLQVTAPSQSTLPQPITLSVLPAGVAAAGSYTANVTFTAGALTKVVPVSLTVSNPRVNFVSPYVATAGVAGNVIIRGRGFPSSGLTVDFGGTAATSPVWVSETEIRAGYPDTLAVGNHPVNVSDGGLPLETRAQLVVVAPPGFAAATIVRQNSPGLVGDLIYDAERQRLYLMDAQQNRLETYRFDAVNWVLEPTILNATGGGVHAIALAPDGTELLMTSGLTMSRINPVTLSTTPVDALPFLGTGGAHLDRIAFTNDGGAVGSAYSPIVGISLYRYDMLTQQFGALSTQFDMINRTIGGSANGSLLMLPTSEPLIPSFAKPLFTYEVGAGTLTQRALLTTGTGFAGLSRDGSRVILINDQFLAGEAAVVYDYNGSFAVRGSLPSPVNGLVISPDGATAYAYYSASGTIREFDLNNPNGSGGFVETGNVAVASPGNFFSRMAISPDGGTLFLAGNERLIVTPVP